MSVLSQFFPSGSGGNDGVRTNILLVGGGAGGNPAGGASCTTSPNLNFASGGGGGGGGQVYEFTNYQISPGSQICVTIGSGGATSSSGGDSSVTIVGVSTVVSKGGRSSSFPGTSLAPDVTCATVDYFYNNGSPLGGGGGGATGFSCFSPSPTPTAPGPGGCIGAIPSGSVYCGVASCISSGVLCNSSVNDNLIRKAIGCPGGTSQCSTCAYPAPSPYQFYSCYRSGIGGGGGGGSAGTGSNGSIKSPAPTPYVPGPCVGCINSCHGGGPGGAGGNAYCSVISGGILSYGAGGGGGGGNFNLITSTAAAQRPCVNYTSIRGCGGISVNGGCGGCGGNGTTPDYPQIPAAPSGCPGGNGTANTGGGGGGGGAGPTTQGTGGSGGSGVAIIQYPTQYASVAAPARPGGCDCSPATPGFYTYKFNGPGSITLP